MNRLTKYFSKNFTASWVILLIDTFFVIVLFPLSLLIRVNFAFNSIWNIELFYHTTEVALFYFLSFLFFKPYVGIVRFTGFNDLFTLIKSSFTAFTAIFVISLLIRFFVINTLSSLSVSALIIHFLFTVVILSFIRISIKILYSRISISNFNQRIRVVIYGSGTAGQRTFQTLVNDQKRFYEVCYYIDDNLNKQGKTQNGVLIKAPNVVLNHDFISKNRIHQLILAISPMDPKRKKEIIEKGIEVGLKIKVVPPLSSWIQGELTERQLKKVKIEDLLGRDEIQLQNPSIENFLNGKVVLVTGAAGSIGSEICRQILCYSPQLLILVDQAESALYDLEMEIQRNKNGKPDLCKYIIADIVNKERIQSVFESYKPNIIFHAAAYKHVPLMENNPIEAVRVNILGTKILSDLSIQYSTEKFVLVSTDKAVNPTNVMGASKRAAEMYIQSLALDKNCKTKFITTRFGNVLGSNGSVIPLFRKQIEDGGPITLTHPDVTRYFMTISEACNLVLEAGIMGKGGEIFVFDMGKSIKIKDLAIKMIHLSGLELDKDIEIKYIGLRPGEKLFEELLANKERVINTHHPKIMIAKFEDIDGDFVFEKIDEIVSQSIKQNNNVVVKTLKEIVLEYKSENSHFEKFDTKH